MSSEKKEIIQESKGFEKFRLSKKMRVDLRFIGFTAIFISTTDNRGKLDFLDALDLLDKLDKIRGFGEVQLVQNVQYVQIVYNDGVADDFF